MPLRDANEKTTNAYGSPPSQNLPASKKVPGPGTKPTTSGGARRMGSRFRARTRPGVGPYDTVPEKLPSPVPIEPSAGKNRVQPQPRSKGDELVRQIRQCLGGKERKSFPPPSQNKTSKQGNRRWSESPSAQKRQTKKRASSKGKEPCPSVEGAGQQRDYYSGPN